MKKKKLKVYSDEWFYRLAGLSLPKSPLMALIFRKKKKKLK